MSNRLAKALTGNIQDITTKSNEIVDDISHPLINISNGSGWGLVDVDGSEEGYGVIGLANDLDNESNHNIDNNSNSNTKDSISLYNDMMGDVLEQELAMSEGRRLDTGPCLPGTRHLMHGKHKITSRVILITASGNVWGTLAFNDKEIYFSSSLEPEGGYKDDSANVNVSMKLECVEEDGRSLPSERYIYDDIDLEILLLRYFLNVVNIGISLLTLDIPKKMQNTEIYLRKL
eukprot:CAMPEP_0196764072 /NCGR_PEP_ID=MMETSP1095-20130614/5319_1 /TAXON_ID=96789 ORGANISM="Chromulina nebulosa, Strain UTEXLB2642" /NCGR_SAMPLE_ID=MMETSP1095 /ASSEMBLY_ACC=CAM_ASM_000446 /LENGTH=231 /DNA_ID=CAMNT_0042118669 /DNA_START=508 /DNA_END=1204 /DNA_ORIENTATION=-